MRRRLTFANVVACVCLFVVLGGDSVAQDVSASAAKLFTGKQVKDRSLTAKDVKGGTLTGRQVKNRSLGARDVKRGSLTGAEVKDGSLTPADFTGSVAGPKGDKGDPGPPGSIQGAPAGGDLAGTYPDPTIGAGKVTSAAIADGSITPADLSLPWALSGAFTDPTLSITGGAGGSNPLLSSVVDGVTAVRPALYGAVNSQFSNFGTAGVYGRSTGTGGYAGLFYASNPAGNAPAVLALSEGTGNGVTANAGGNGDGVETTADGNGSALYAWAPSFSTARVARLVNFSSTNTNPVLTAETRSAGSIAVFRSGNPSAANVARIDAAGRGFFNGGTQVGGADLAEVVPTCGTVRKGDVVEIDPERPDCFRRSTAAGSPRVAGVISSAPGVTLNVPDGADAESTSPALALAGRVPVKVTGDVRIGDLLVASSRPGHAMRAPADPAVGTVIGKALEPFDGGRGSIRMLVMAR